MQHETNGVFRAPSGLKLTLDEEKKPFILIGHGRYTAEAIASRREIAALIKAMRALACATEGGRLRQRLIFPTFSEFRGSHSDPVLLGRCARFAKAKLTAHGVRSMSASHDCF